MTHLSGRRKRAAGRGLGNASLSHWAAGRSGERCDWRAGAAGAALPEGLCGPQNGGRGRAGGQRGWPLTGT